MKQRDDAAKLPATHLTEGELHAFLDGQVDVFGAVRAGEIRSHLDSCASCRDRLVVESAVHDRAAGILGTEVGPEMLGLASLAELQARAAHGSGGTTAPVGGRGRLERRVTWGWAATVVLSLGIGYGVGAWGPERLADPAVGDVPAPPAAPAPVSADVPAVPANDPASVAANVVANAAMPPVDADAASLGGAPSGADESTAAPTTGTAPVEADRVAPMPPRDPRRTVAEVVPSLERVAPIQEPEEPLAKALFGARPDSPDSAVALDSLAARSRMIEDRLDALQSATPSPVLRDVAERVASSGSTRLSVDATPPTRLLRSDATGVPLGSGTPANPPLLESTVPGDVGSDVSLVLEGLTIDVLRWIEVWPGQQGLLSVQRFPDGRLVELRIAGPAVGDGAPVEPPPAERTEPIEGWARAIAPLGSGWVALDGPLAVKELAALLATIR